MSEVVEPVLQAEADVIVVGGGAAGATVAGTIVERSAKRVILVEAGPDYGPKGSGRWPEGLMDPAIQTFSHDWGYRGVVNGRVVDFPRARVLGGCSAINGAAVVHGSRGDYDGWAAAGNDGWSADELAPLFESAWRHLSVRQVGRDELTPFQRASIDALVDAGIPEVDDLNDLDQDQGVAPFPTNTDAGGVRINSAFGYIDPQRASRRLTVLGDAPAIRVLVRDGAVEGVVVRHRGHEHVIRAPRVVVSGGAYGSPALLQRSGIGSAATLAAAGIEPVHLLHGVGRNLHDQPTVQVDYAGTARLAQAMRSFRHAGRRRDEQVIAKFRSSECRDGFDLHIFPIGGPRDDPDSAGRDVGFTIGGAVLTPLSRGYVEVTGPALDDRLTIDHGYLTDPQGSDLARLVEVVQRIREAAAAEPLRSLLGTELHPGPAANGRGLATAISSTVVHYYHPAGSCKMGPSSDPGAVVGADGAVHGLSGLFVADASIMPSVVSGNTNMPTIVIGEKVGRHIAASP
jgi:choline dehydrogenase-like flavoprotein